MYKGVSSLSLRVHFDPARIKTPLYQNILEIFFLVFYLVLYTIILNTHKREVTPLDVFEIAFYLCTLGLVIDEVSKFYHVGFNYLGFWNALNDTMYAIIAVAVGFRFAALLTSVVHQNYDEISFRILSCAAPFMWCRLLLYLDAQKFVGAMLVVIKTMMKESILFFVLLLVVILGFLQGLLGLDALDGKSESTKHILISLVKTVIGGSSFADVAKLVPPYALILYYVYSFLLSVILMNILIALYSTSYASIVANANDEYFALVAQKTLRYIRAPDQDLYVPPFNLVELLLLPLKWVTERHLFKRLNHLVMLVIYSPLLCYIAYYELANARRIQYNRFKGVADDANELDTEWDLTDGYDVEAQLGWEGIQERNSELAQQLRVQHDAEQRDPEFRINKAQFDRDIHSVVKPVKEANRLGIKWELYEVYSKIDKLTDLVEKLAEDNKALRERLEPKVDVKEDVKEDVKDVKDVKVEEVEPKKVKKT